MWDPAGSAGASVVQQYESDAELARQLQSIESQGQQQMSSFPAPPPPPPPPRAPQQPVAHSMGSLQATRQQQQNMTAQGQASLVRPPPQQFHPSTQSIQTRQQQLRASDRSQNHPRPPRQQDYGALELGPEANWSAEPVNPTESAVPGGGDVAGRGPHRCRV